MARICELTGKRPMKGSIIWRSGKSKKSGGIGTHITAITKRRFFPNLQRVNGVANVSIWGQRERQLQVQVDPKRLAERKITLDVTVAAKEYLANEGFDPVYGARPLARVTRPFVAVNDTPSSRWSSTPR